MDIEKEKNKITDSDLSNIEVTEKIEVPSWAEQSQDEKSSDYSFTIRGTNMLKVPCFKSTMMYSIGSGMLTGIAYNLGTSRPPGKIAFGTYTIVLFGSWIYCRYNYRKRKLLQVNNTEYKINLQCVICTI